MSNSEWDMPSSAADIQFVGCCFSVSGIRILPSRDSQHGNLGNSPFPIENIRASSNGGFFVIAMLVSRRVLQNGKNCGSFQYWYYQRLVARTCEGFFVITILDRVALNIWQVHKATCHRNLDQAIFCVTSHWQTGPCKLKKIRKKNSTQVTVCF